MGQPRGKAPTARAITYPALALALPLHRLLRRPDGAYPWVADLLLTLTGFSDVLGNRLDLYDRVVWFDDWMHFMNVGLICAAVLLVTVPVATGLLPLAERSVAVGMTAGLAWELFEYAAFVTRSREHAMAYSDTLGDLALGWLGAAVAATAVHLARGTRPAQVWARWHDGTPGRTAHELPGRS